MKRRIFFGLLCGIFFVSAQESLNQKFIAKTRYFDIIYSKKSEASAAILAENADKIYEELAEFYGLSDKFRLPVTINHDYQVFNAYFSFAPFNHIVLYETLPGESYAFSEDSFLNTFRHELTHAITMNLQTGFWKGLKSVFGDSANVGALFDTTFMIEGSAVESESLKGDGRNNSEFNRHLVKQAKIEGVFPKFSEVQGALDFSPGTEASYIFGGLFWEWIVQKFGHEKFSLFWNKCSNFQTLTYFTGFKSVYGLSFKDAWNLFYDEIKIPEKLKIPFQTEGIENFADSKKTSNPKILSSSKNLISYYDSGEIFIAEKKPSQKDLKFKKVLSQMNVQNLKFSSDGRFLCVNYNSNLSKFPKRRALIFDTQKKSVFHFKQDGISDFSVLKNGSDYFLVFQQAGTKNDTENLNPSIKVHKIVFSKNGKIKLTQEIFSEKLGFLNQGFSFCDGGDGSLYFIFKNGMNLSLNVVKKTESSFKIQKILDFPKGMTVRNFSADFENCFSGADKTNFIFSYSEKAAFVRLGFLSIDFSKNSAEISLMKDDVSGGIFNPVSISASSVAWNAKFYNHSQILCAPLVQFLFEKKSLDFCKEFFQDKTEFKSFATPNFEFLSNAKKFYFKNYFYRGTLIPIYSLNCSKRISPYLDSLENSGLPVGLTYISGSTLTFPLYGVSGAWDFLSNSGIFSYLLYGRTDTSIFNYSVSGFVEFDGKGYKQSVENLNFSSLIELNRNWNFSLSDSFQFFEGRQNLYSFNAEKDYSNPFNYFESLKNFSQDKWLFGNNEFTLGFSNVKSTGSGFFERSGVSFSGNFETVYVSRADNFENKFFFNNLALNCSVQFPFLIPVQDENSVFTFNLPFVIQGNLFPAAGYFASLSGTFVLFNWEIQKSFNWTPGNLLYFNRIYVYLSYLGKFSDEKLADSFSIFKFPEFIKSFSDSQMKYSDILKLTGSMTFTPNFGGLANPNFALTLSAAFAVRFSALPNEKQFIFSWSLTGNF